MNPFEEMHTFVRIVEAGSITRAADQMNTVKSAVSKRLRELEKRLGITLLNRTTRTQTLTDSGRSYYEQCLRILTDLEEVEASVRNEQSALVGRIRIAAPLVFGVHHLSKALLSFNQLHPDIFLDLDLNDRKVDLIEEGFDLAIRIAKLDDSSLIARKLFTSRSVLCASKDYIQRCGMPKHPRDLLHGHTCLYYSGAPRDGWTFNTETGQSLSVKVPASLSANNGDLLTEAAIAGQGLLFTPDFIAHQAIRSGQLQLLLEDYLIDNQVSGYALYPQTRHLSHRVRALVDYLVAWFGKEPYWRI